jgi:hypothetical protein
MSRSSFELENQTPSSPQIGSIDRPAEENVLGEPANREQSLEPADGGASAWRVLIGAFVFEAILWGKFSEHNFRAPADPDAKDFLFRLVFSKITTLSCLNSRMIHISQ